MDLPRAVAVAILKRVGRPDLAAQAESDLPDPVSQEDLFHWAENHGISRGWLVDRMGGSP